MHLGPWYTVLYRVCTDGYSIAYCMALQQHVPLHRYGTVSKGSISFYSHCLGSRSDSAPHSRRQLMTFLICMFSLWFLATLPSFRSLCPRKTCHSMLVKLSVGPISSSHGDWLALLNLLDSIINAQACGMRWLELLHKATECRPSNHISNLSLGLTTLFWDVNISAVRWQGSVGLFFFLHCCCFEFPD